MKESIFILPLFILLGKLKTVEIKYSVSFWKSCTELFLLLEENLNNRKILN